MVVPLDPQDFEVPQDVIDAEQAIQIDIGEVAAGVAELQGNLEGADELLEAVEFLLNNVDPALNDAAEIPIEPLPDLEPVAQGAEVVRRGISMEVLPVVVVVLAIVREISRLFQTHERKSSYASTEKLNRYVLFQQARSVTVGLNEKYGSNWPGDFSRVTREIKTAFSEIDAKIDDEKRRLLKEIKNKLESISLIKTITDDFAPIGRFLEEVNSYFKKALNTKIARGLRRVVKLFKEWGHFVDGKIKSALKSMGIDPNFIDELKAKIAKYEDDIIREALSPLKNLEQTAVNKLKPLETELSGVLAKFSDLQTLINSAFSPADALLQYYISLAKEHGVVPKQWL